MKPACLGEEELAQFAQGTLRAELRSTAERHLRECESCRMTLAALVDLEAGEVPPSLASPFAAELRGPVVALGTSLGRYELRERLGAGGMGVVYSAWDRELDRLVALKLLWSASDPTAHAARLRAEAQALAKIRDPHVVTVFEVKTHGDQLFMAMELVEGLTLASWLGAVERPWEEILRVFREAGQGLAAAHHVGLVHRDFKPGNVLVGRDGRVRVSDFGLATEGTDASLGGTPAYMPPEQLAGGEASALGDQFSFCVALFEGLCAQRPFQAARSQERLEAMRQPPRWTTHARRVPAWVRRAVERGLRFEPEARFASMQALLAELDARPRERRRRLQAAVAAAVGCVLAGFAASAWWSRPRGACAEQRPWGGVWDEAVKRKVGDALAAVPAPFAAPALRTTTALLDGYATAWSTTREAVCAESKGEPDARLRCLARQRAEVQHLTSLLANADALVAEHAVSAARALEGPARCLSASQAPPALPPERALALEDGLAKARALRSLARFAQARDEARSTAVEAQRWGSERLRAEAMTLAAQAERDLGALDVAAASADDALEAATASGTATADIWLTSMAIEDARAHGEAAHRAARFADAALRAMKEPPQALRIARELQVGRLAYDENHTAEALAAFERAAALAAGTNTSLEAVSAAAEGRADALAQLGRFDEAAVVRQTAFDELARALGVEHPLCLRLQFRLGAGLAERGLPAAAVPLLREVLAQASRVVGEQHPLTASISRMLGWALLNQGAWAEAEASLLRSLGQRSFPLPAEHPTPIDLRFLFATIEWERTERPAAFAKLEELMAEERRLRPTEALWVSFALDVVGRRVEQRQLAPAGALLEELERAIAEEDLLMGALVLELRGRLEAAEGHAAPSQAAFDQARALHARMHTQDGLLYALMRHSEGVALAALGKKEEARRALEEAIALRRRQGDAGVAKSQRALEALGR